MASLVYERENCIAERPLLPSKQIHNHPSIFFPLSYFTQFIFTLSNLIIYMKKLLDSDWLRTVQFFLNTVQKRGN